MIAAKELRLGNITDKGGIKNFWEKGVHVGFGKCYEFTELNPIPLTEEWLLKFGFEQTEFCFKIGYFFLTKGLGSSTGKFLYQAHKYRFSVKSVHQLQNLYWCLCQKELSCEN